MPKKMKSMSNAAYTHSLIELTNCMLRDYLNEHLPELGVDEDGYRPRPDLEEMKEANPEDYQIEKARYLPKEAEYALNHLDEIVHNMVKNRPEVTTKPSMDRVNEFCKTVNPDYKPIGFFEQRQRAARSDALRQKFMRYSTERELAIQMLRVEPPNISRTEETILRPRCDMESLRFNEMLKEAAISKDPEKLRNAYGQAIENLMSIDLEHIDLTDDQYIVDHFEEMHQLLSSGPEIKAVVDEYQKYADMSDPKYNETFLRLNAMQDMSAILRMKIDIMASPSYSQIRYEDLGDYTTIMPDDDSPIHNLFDDPTGKTLDEKVEAQKEYDQYKEIIGQHGYVNGLYGKSPYLDQSLTPEQRFEKLRQEFNDPKLGKKYNVRAKAPEKTDENAKTDEMTELKDIEELKREAQKKEQRESEVKLSDIRQKRPEKPQKTEKLTIEAKSEEQVLDEEYGGEFDNIENLEQVEQLGESSLSDKDIQDIQADAATAKRLQEYETKFRRNLELIQKVIPDFQMSDEEIKEYVNPERLKFQDAVNAYDEKVNEVSKFSKGMPGSFSRNAPNFLDKSGTPEAEKRNEETAELLKADTLEGHKFRKEMFVKITNDVMKLDESKLSPSAPRNETLNYIMENMDTVHLGWEFQKTNHNKHDSLGITLDPETEQEMKKVENRAVELGGIGGNYIKMAQMGAFMTTPFDKLSPEQGAKIMEYLSGQPKLILHEPELQRAFAAQNYFSSAIHNLKVSPESNKKEFSAKDFKDSIPTVEETKTKLNEIYQGLKGADHWYNARNSEEYKNLLANIEKCQKELGKVDGSFDVYPEKLQQSLQDVFRATTNYVSHTGDKAKNETQQTRLDLTKQLQSFISPFQDDKRNFNVFVEKHNLAVQKHFSEELHSEGNTFTQEQEQFGRAESRTNKLREETDKLPDGDHKQVNERQLQARDRLLDMVGRENLDMNEVKPLVAQVIVGTKMNALYKQQNEEIQENGGVEKFEEVSRFIEKSEEFNKVFSEMKPKDLASFLEGPGEKTMANKMDQMVQQKRNLQANKNPQAAANKTAAQKTAPSKPEKNIIAPQ